MSMSSPRGVMEGKGIWRGTGVGGVRRRRQARMCIYLYKLPFPRRRGVVGESWGVVSGKLSHAATS